MRATRGRRLVRFVLAKTLHRGWRIRLSSAHSPNATSATNGGLTGCAWQRNRIGHGGSKADPQSSVRSRRYRSSLRDRAVQLGPRHRASARFRHDRRTDQGRASGWCCSRASSRRPSGESNTSARSRVLQPGPIGPDARTASRAAITTRYPHLSPGRARTGSGCTKRLQIDGTLTALHGSRIRKNLLLPLIK